VVDKQKLPETSADKVGTLHMTHIRSRRHLNAVTVVLCPELAHCTLQLSEALRKSATPQLASHCRPQ
jgi:hypothetical protein